jgi:hypothetical protein
MSPGLFPLGIWQEMRLDTFQKGYLGHSEPLDQPGGVREWLYTAPLEFVPGGKPPGSPQEPIKMGTSRVTGGFTQRLVCDILELVIGSRRPYHLS